MAHNLVNFIYLFFLMSGGPGKSGSTLHLPALENPLHQVTHGQHLVWVSLAS